VRLEHANVDTTLNVYAQVLDGSVRRAVATIGEELFTTLAAFRGRVLDVATSCAIAHRIG